MIVLVVLESFTTQSVDSFQDLDIHYKQIIIHTSNKPFEHESKVDR